MKENIYSFSATRLNGEEEKIAIYQNKVLLIVNTASQCGFTPQYEGLQALYKKYNSQGFEILAFPCNQFGGQEPGSAADIKNFCDINYKVTFPMFAKIEVNGDNAHPLYKYLTKTAPGFLGSRRIKWNFTKFIIDRNGNVAKRFASTTKPKEIETFIGKLL